MGTAVVNGKFIDSNNHVSVRNLMVQNGKVTGIGYIPDEDENAIDVIDITQSLILPNTFDFIYTSSFGDLPNFVQSVQSKGIFNIGLIPNEKTTLLDDPALVQAFLSHSPNVGSLHVFASATKNNLPDELSELSLLHQAGAAGIYFGRIIENESLLKQALTYIDMIGCPIIIGPLTHFQADNCHLNEGDVSFKIGIRGESIDSEYQRVQYLLSLIKQFTTVPIHFLALSSAHAIDYIHQFKQSYSNITIGAAPFHLLLDDSLLSDYNTRFKFNPPLRSIDDALLLKTALKNNYIDHFTSLHSPADPESQPNSFYDTLPYTQTLSCFFQLASHLFIDAGYTLDQIQSLFNAPSFLSSVHSNELNLNDSATFIALKNSGTDDYQQSVFSSHQLNLNGGVDLILLNGEVQ